MKSLKILIIFVLIFCEQSFLFSQTQEKPSPFKFLLKEGEKLFNEKRYYDACLTFHKILSDGDENESYYKKAQYLLALGLYNLKLYLSSYTYFDRIVEDGAKHPNYMDTLRYLIYIHRELPGDTSVLARMADYPKELYPEDLANEINFFVGQHYYYEINLDSALQSLNNVSSKSPELYLKALYLKGVVYVRKNQAIPAAEAFKEILRFIDKHGMSTSDIKKLRDMAILTLARIFYSTGQSEISIKYYDEIPDSSENWLESLFEKSWAFFQLGNYARALGNLHTLNSPYFEAEYFPESYVLKATILFYNCHYEEVLETVDPFYKEYYELLKEIEKLVKTQQDPNEFYKYLARLSKKGEQIPLKLKRILNAALTDKRIKRLFGFIIQINKEFEQLEEMKKHDVAKRLSEILLPDIVAYRSLVISLAGKLAQERLNRVYKELKKFLAQALRIKFETFNAQKGIIERELKEEQIIAKEKEKILDVDYEHALWLFEGEYWRDELGSYYYPIVSKCKE